MLSIEQINKLQEENERLKKENEILLGQLVINDGEDVTVQISKSQFDEYNQFKDMAKKGLEEFKDVGGCWGCGLQLQLNQDMEDIKQLKAENERLKRINDELHSIIRRKKEQLKTVNYMLFEDKDMTKSEWKLKYKLAKKDRRYQSYQYMAKQYKTCLQEIKGIAENQDILRGRQALATKILDIINKAEV